MKKNRLISFLGLMLSFVFVAGFAGCSDDDDNKKSNSYLVIELPNGTSPSTISLPDAGGSQTIQITTNGPWEVAITGDPTGTITVSPTSGDYSSEFTIRAERNPGTPITATLTAKLRNNESVVKTMTITQAVETSSVTLNSPANRASVNLNTVTGVEFSWTGENITGGYQLVISESSEIDTEDITISQASTTYTFPAAALDAELESLGLGIGETRTLYWTVKPTGQNAPLKEDVEIREIELRRIIPSNADMLDVIFDTDGTAFDISSMKLPVTDVRKQYMYDIEFSSLYGRNIANFKPQSNGEGGSNDSYFKVNYTNSTVFKEKLAAGHTFECLVKFDENYADGVDRGYETKFMSTHQAGGTGFVVGDPGQSNALCFITHTGGWRFANSGIRPEADRWYHLVGVWNKETAKVYIYVDGEFKGEGDAPGNYQTVNSASVEWVGIGGDPANDNDIERPTAGSVALARIYGKAFTAAEAQALWDDLNQ